MDLSSFTGEMDVRAGIIVNGEPIGSPPTAMMTATHLARTTVHIIEPDASVRANSFRTLKAIGFHCEIYASVTELIDFKPSAGIVLVHEYAGGDTVADVRERTRNAGLALSTVGCAEQPTIEAVVSAMRAGALDYLLMPFDVERLEQVLTELAGKDVSYRREHGEQATAFVRLQRLSIREREVLELLVQGAGNKQVARDLGISPRTVEIHRMKMMGKLGACNATAAVRTWLLATGLETSTSQPRAFSR